MIKGRTGNSQKHEVVEGDLIPFLKVFCCLMFYKCTIADFFSDEDNMYKRYPMGEGISMVKFRLILGAFKSKHDRNTRSKLNKFLGAQRKFYGCLLFAKKWCLVSLDDDKQRMRSLLCETEGFVRQRHAKGGGFGPVQHVAASQLTHFVLGCIINSPGSSDDKSVEQLLYDVDEDADCIGQTDHNLVPYFIDRGHRLSAVEAAFVRANCHMVGTTQRRKTVQEFPCTFEHPDKEGDVPSEGVPVSLHSRKGTNVALAYRGFQGKVVLIKSTMPTWTIPRQGFFVPPPAAPVILSSASSIPAAVVLSASSPIAPASTGADVAVDGGSSAATPEVVDLMVDQDNDSDNFLTQAIPDDVESWCESVNSDASDTDDESVPNEASRVANAEELLAQPTDAVLMESTCVTALLSSICESCLTLPSLPVICESCLTYPPFLSRIGATTSQ
jgi:hypothetical protein